MGGGGRFVGFPAFPSGSPAPAFIREAHPRRRGKKYGRLGGADHDTAKNGTGFNWAGERNGC